MISLLKETIMNNPGIINHKIYGLGLVAAMNRTEDQNLRLLIVWKDVEQAGAICGWYIFQESDFIIGENKCE